MLRPAIIAAIAALSVAAHAYEQPLREDSNLDFAAGAFATNIVCGPVFSNDQLVRFIRLAAGQIGVSPNAIRETLHARTVVLTGRLQAELAAPAEREQWCGEMRAIADRI